MSRQTFMVLWGLFVLALAALAYFAIVSIMRYAGGERGAVAVMLFMSSFIILPGAAVLFVYGEDIRAWWRGLKTQDEKDEAERIEKLKADYEKWVKEDCK